MMKYLLCSVFVLMIFVLLSACVRHPSRKYQNINGHFDNNEKIHLNYQEKNIDMSLRLREQLKEVTVDYVEFDSQPLHTVVSNVNQMIVNILGDCGHPYLILDSSNMPIDKEEKFLSVPISFGPYQNIHLGIVVDFVAKFSGCGYTSTTTNITLAPLRFEKDGEPWFLFESALETERVQGVGPANNK